jgi:hypothetical protein
VCSYACMHSATEQLPIPDSASVCSFSFARAARLCSPLPLLALVHSHSTARGAEYVVQNGDIVKFRVMASAGGGKE